ncbi:DnaJ-domain-containing protein [Piromyces finnis]|uniref:DnaJ-domain-containing protein n=1 Tax=Piromyces finnis TaxID=1754191 RepID=A0A1Y1V772_9FUNG|nr:DnaJ-domain-containing protein [Piromyces finnis]|eukprot:ORX48424.1 DnaJ-domain-containing protein [Piromyces finnis]
MKRLFKLVEPGEQLINDKRYDEGVSYFSKLIEKFPNEAELYNKRASCYIYLENAEKAIEDSTKAISLDKLNLKSYFRNLRCYIFLGNVEKAKYYAENGLKFSKKTNISKMNNKLFETELNNIIKLEELLKNVKLNYQRRKYTNALKYLEEAFLIADPTLEQRIKLRDGISMFGNISTNGVCKEWQLFRGKILLKCKQFTSAKKIASTMTNKYPLYLHGQFFSTYMQYIYDEIPTNDIIMKLKDIIKSLNNDDDNEVDLFENDDILNEVLDFHRAVEEIERLKKKHNDEYNQEKYKSADNGYYQCLKTLDFYELYGISYIKLLSNISNTKSKLNNYRLSVNYCTSGIEMLENIIIGSNKKKVEIKIREINKSSFKYLFTKLYMRRASSYRQQKFYEKAIHDYEFLLKLLPDDNEIKQNLNDTKYEKENKNNNSKDNNSNNNNNNSYKNNNSSADLNTDDNYYTLLGLKFEDNPDINTIKKSFHKMALKYHPDKCTGKSSIQKEEAERKFKKINEAYSVLSNNDSKQAYDNKLKYSNFFKVYFDSKPDKTPQKKQTVSTDELLDRFINEENKKKFFFGWF